MEKAPQKISTKIQPLSPDEVVQSPPRHAYPPQIPAESTPSVSYSHSNLTSKLGILPAPKQIVPSENKVSPEPFNQEQMEARLKSLQETVNSMSQENKADDKELAPAM